MNVESANYSNSEKTNVQAIIDTETVFVPVDDNNRHYRAIQEWVSQGGVIVEYKEPAPVYPPLTARQIRLALNKMDMLDKVQPMIDALSGKEKSDAQIEWDYATTFEHDNWLVQMMAHTLDIPKDEFDDLWVWASRL